MPRAAAACAPSHACARPSSRRPVCFPHIRPHALRDPAPLGTFPSFCIGRCVCEIHRRQQWAQDEVEALPRWPRILRSRLVSVRSRIAQPPLIPLSTRYLGQRAPACPSPAASACQTPACFANACRSAAAASAGGHLLACARQRAVLRAASSLHRACNILTHPAPSGCPLPSSRRLSAVWLADGLGAMLDANVASAGTREKTEMASLVRRGDCIGCCMSVPCAAAGAPLKFVLARCLVDAVVTVPRSGVLPCADSRFSATEYYICCFVFLLHECTVAYCHLCVRPRHLVGCACGILCCR